MELQFVVPLEGKVDYNELLELKKQFQSLVFEVDPVDQKQEILSLVKDDENSSDILTLRDFLQLGFLDEREKAEDALADDLAWVYKA